MDPHQLDPATAQQTLDVLRRVQHKILVDLYTTLILVAGLFLVFTAQIAHLFRCRKTAYVMTGGFGAAMTLVPATAAIYLGYATIILCAVSIFREVKHKDPEIKLSPKN